MFDSCYQHKFICNKLFKANGEDDVTKRVHLFAFRGKGGHRYIIEVEQYEYHLYALKYYLKAHSNSPNRYSLATGLNEMPAVIRTCLNVMLEMYNNDPRASFGFIGAASLGESIAHTQRYRIYRSVMENFFKPELFQHYSDTDRSLYFILNRQASMDVADGLELHIIKIWNSICRNSAYTPFEKT